MTTAPAGFAEFYNAEYLRVVLFLRKQGASWEDAWDAMQTAFLKAMRRWSEIDSPRAWVRATASRAYGRAQYRVVEDRDRASRSDWVMPDWFDPTAIPEEENRVIEAITSLPFRQRQVMAWHYDGYTNQEIAQILGITPEDVASNLYQGRRRLRTWVDQQPGLSSVARIGGAR